LLSAVDLAKYLRAKDAADDERLDLLEIPAARQQLAGISMQANLQEAHMLLQQESVEALYVHGHIRARANRIYGVLTPELVESAYRI